MEQKNVKPYWQPKEDQVYWIPNDDEKRPTVKQRWEGYDCEIMWVKSGDVFKTKKDCLAYLKVRDEYIRKARKKAGVDY